MELKQLRSFVAVVREGGFTRAAEKTYLSQPTISTHLRALEEELGTSLILRDTKNIKVTRKGWELYECAVHMLELHDGLLQRWSQETRRIIRLGASTIPSAYILPELLPRYGQQNSETYFIVHQSDSSEVIRGLRSGLFDLGMTGMECEDGGLRCVPFYQDRMVLITPVTPRFLAMQEQKTPVEQLLQEPIILREKGSGSLKSASRFLERIGISEDSLNVTARINDQESIKNLVAGGLGVSIVSQKAAENFVREKRLLQFELLDSGARRDLYLVFPREGVYGAVKHFVDFIMNFYGA